MISLLFYKLMLKRETYHQLNRMVLLACLAVSFTLPFIPVPQQFSFIKENTLTASVIKPTVYKEPSALAVTTPTHSLQQQVAAAPPNHLAEATTDSFNKESMVKWAFWIYWIGVIIFGANLLIQLVVLSYKIFKSEAIYDGKYRIVELNDDKAPCSFGNYIFINPAKYEWDTYDQILIHEKVHVQQYHTLDLIIAEIMVVFQWFNPLAWLYRKEIENNLEFLTDHTVIDRYKVKQHDYQLNLLKVSVPNYAMTITTNYNQSLLKQRIMMMNSRRSNIHIVWKYFAIIPLFICMISLLNKPVAASAQIAQKLPTDTLKKKSKVIQNNRLIVQKNKIVKQTGTLAPKNTLGPKNGLTNQINDNAAVSNVIIDRAVTYAQPSGSNVIIDKVVTNGDKKYFTADDLIKLQAHGITAGYIQGIRSSGFINFKADDIIKLQANGITTGYIQGISSSGFMNFTANDIVKLQANGITNGYIQGISSAGYKDFTADDIIKLQANGIKAGYAQGLSPK
jgi:hypothetical protein